MHWIILAILTAFFYGAYNFFIKASSGHINQLIGAITLQVVAALVSGIIFLFLRVTNNPPLTVSKEGLLYAAVAGVFVGLAEITSFYVFSKGVSASAGIPVIIGGAVIFGALLGSLFFKEALTPLEYLGILCILAGVVILAK